jgi:hypothetical protein
LSDYEPPAVLWQHELEKPMKMADLLAKLGGRPPLHWECPEFLGGCGEVFEKEIPRCPSCNNRVWQVTLYSDRELNLHKMPAA